MVYDCDFLMIKGAAVQVEKHKYAEKHVMIEPRYQRSFMLVRQSRSLNPTVVSELDFGTSDSEVL